MNCHFSTRMLNNDGNWKTLTDMKNSSSDVSCVSGQMPRIVGLAYASKLYRKNKNLSDMQNFSINGNEVIFGTIGDASTSEGHFWEAINACGVLQVPVVMSIWDDGYGISVPSEYHTTRNDLSKVLSGFQRVSTKEKGFEIFTVNAWDYIGLLKAYLKADQLENKKRCHNDFLSFVKFMWEDFISGYHHKIISEKFSSFYYLSLASIFNNY